MLDPESIEAETRRLMSVHASISPRGFDSIRQRAYLHRDIDEQLDMYADALALAGLDDDHASCPDMSGQD
jgi:hypothetical protein